MKEKRSPSAFSKKRRFSSSSKAVGESVELKKTVVALGTGLDAINHVTGGAGFASGGVQCLECSRRSNSVAVR